MQQKTLVMWTRKRQRSLCYDMMVYYKHVDHLPPNYPVRRYAPIKIDYGNGYGVITCPLMGGR